MFTENQNKAKALRVAVAQANMSQVIQILTSVNKEQAKALIDTAGPDSGKTTVHRALEGLLEYGHGVTDIFELINNFTRELSQRETFLVNLYMVTTVLLRFGPNMNLRDRDRKTGNDLLAALPAATQATLANEPAPIKEGIDMLMLAETGKFSELIEKTFAR